MSLTVLALSWFCLSYLSPPPLPRPRRFWLEADNITAAAVDQCGAKQHQLIAPGEVRTAQGTFAARILASYDGPRDIYTLPVNTNGDRVVTLGDLAQIRVAFDDRLGTAGFNGATTVARQVMTRKGVHLLDITTLERTTHEKSPCPLRKQLTTAVVFGREIAQARKALS